LRLPGSPQRGTGAVRGVLREEAVKAGALKIDFCV